MYSLNVLLANRNILADRISCIGCTDQDLIRLIERETLMETKDSMLEKLFAKAEEDTDFRGLLLADPRSALKESLGVEVPENFNVVVHEDDARTAHLGAAGLDGVD